MRFLSCSTIYNMCTQKPPYDYSEQLYQRYKDAFNNYINEMVSRTAVPAFDWVWWRQINNWGRQMVSAVDWVWWQQINNYSNAIIPSSSSVACYSLGWRQPIIQGPSKQTDQHSLQQV